MENSKGLNWMKNVLTIFFFLLWLTSFSQDTLVFRNKKQPDKYLFLAAGDKNVEIKIKNEKKFRAIITGYSNGIITLKRPDHSQDASEKLRYYRWKLSKDSALTKPGKDSILDAIDYPFTRKISCDSIRFIRAANSAFHPRKKITTIIDISMGVSVVGIYLFYSLQPPFSGVSPVIFFGVSSLFFSAAVLRYFLSFKTVDLQEWEIHRFAKGTPMSKPKRPYYEFTIQELFFR